MEFKNWLNEISEPTQPLNKIKRNKITKDGGTWRERSVIEFNFKTTKGNDIKLHFDKIEDGYDIMFYVNDTQHDDAAGSERDPEIISNILWLIRKKADELKANILTFIAQKGDGDRRIIKNLDINKFKPEAKLELNQMKHIITNYQVKMLQRNPAVYLKINKPIPPDYPDLDKETYLKILNAYESTIENGNLTELLNNTIHQFDDLSRLGINSQKFINSMKKLANAQESNTDQGYQQTRNRREFLWEKLVHKYFPDWTTEKYGTKFQLTRNERLS